LKAQLSEQETKWRKAYEKVVKENELLRTRGGETVLAVQWRERYEVRALRVCVYSGTEFCIVSPSSLRVSELLFTQSSLDLSRSMSVCLVASFYPPQSNNLVIYCNLS
jgi:hypothetical protein